MDKFEFFSNISSYRPAVQITIATNKISGVGSLLAPTLVIPIEMVIHQLEQEHPSQIFDHEILQINGSLILPPYTILANISPDYIFQKSFKNLNSHPHSLFILLDNKRIELIEKQRRGGDQKLKLKLTCITKYEVGEKTKIEKLHSPYDGIEFTIPQSKWVKDVLNKWDYTTISLVEIKLNKEELQGLPLEVIEQLEKAKILYLNYQFKETVAAIYSSFEMLARKQKMKNPDKNFFSKLLSQLPHSKRQKYQNLFHEFCNLLHIGRHVPEEMDYQIDFKDAQLIFILGQTILSNISTNISSENNAV